MLAIETELIAAIETNISLYFVENGVGKDGIKLAELSDIIRREKAHFLDTCSSEEHICSQKNS